MERASEATLRRLQAEAEARGCDTVEYFTEWQGRPLYWLHHSALRGKRGKFGMPLFYVITAEGCYRQLERRETVSLIPLLQRHNDAFKQLDVEQQAVHA